MAPQRSLRSQLLLLEAVIAIPLLLLWVWSVWQRWDDARHAAGESVSRLARVAAARGSEIQTDGLAILDRLAQRPSIRDLERCDPVFTDFPATHGDFAGLARLDAAGAVRCTGETGRTVLPYGAPSMLASLAGGSEWALTPPHRTADGRWVVFLLRALQAPNGASDGALALAIDVERYQAILGAASSPGQTATLITPGGTVVARITGTAGDRDWIGRDASQAGIARVIQNGADGHRIARGLDGSEQVFGNATLPGSGWKVAIGVPTATLLAPVRGDLARGGLIGLGILVLVAALTVRLARGIERPVRGLAVSTERVMAGHYDQPIPVGGPREVAEVADRFNQMLEVRRQAEEERQRLERELRDREVMSAMGALVAGVAHEVRNPLFGLSATVDAFEVRFGNQPDHKPYLEMLRKGLDQLTRLMKELIDYGRPVAPAVEPVPLEAAAREAVENVAPVATDAGVQVAIESAPGLAPACVDAVQLRQVLSNLIENAIQHSPPGSEVRVRLTPDDGLPRARVEVLDRGPGFRADDLEHAFEPFYSRRKGGIGLGLSIVRKLVEGVGGRVELGNRAEGGGFARVVLPVQDGDPCQERPREGATA